MLQVLADAIGAIGDATAESALLARLTVESTEARVAVINALGLVGSASAVDDLLPLTHGLAQPGSVKAAARGAIARIQSRLLGAAEGQLSIADLSQKAGTLSLSDTQGALSDPSDGTSPTRKVEEDVDSGSGDSRRCSDDLLGVFILSWLGCLYWIFFKLGGGQTQPRRMGS